MKVLIACEFSGIVRDAFIARGHDAKSVDLLPSERPGPHYQGEIIDFINRSPKGYWDLMIAFPPCTYLTNAGVRWLYGGGGTIIDKERWAKMENDALLFKTLLNVDIPHIAVENPTMHKYAREIVGEKSAFTIQPFDFGHPESKRTGYWVRNLPPLQPTNVLTRPEIGYWDNQTPSGQNKLGQTKNRWKDRSRTLQGVADAMAEQWGGNMSG